MRYLMMTAAIVTMLAVECPAVLGVTFIGEDESCSIPTVPPDLPMRPASTENSDRARAQFLAALGTTVQMESFERFDFDARPSVLQFGSTVAALTGSFGIGGPTVFAVPDEMETTLGGGYPITGQQALVVWGVDSASSFTVTFESQQAALSFYMIDLEVSTLTLTFDPDDIPANGGEYEARFVPPARCANGNHLSGRLAFIGIIERERPFKRVTFHNSAVGDAVVFDDLAIAATTGPECSGCCGDCNNDGQVTIGELVGSVNRAVSGCP